MSTTEQPPSTAAAAANPVPGPTDDLRVFVGNLPLSADAKQLKAVFRDAEARAQVNVARVTRAPRGKGRYAIVTFKSEEDKSKGIDSLAKKFEGAAETDAAASALETASSDVAENGKSDEPAENGEARPTKLTFGVAPAKPKAPKAERKPAGSSPSAGSAGSAGSAAGDASTEGNDVAPKSKPAAKPKRAPAKFVPRPSAVYVTLPPHTEADEVRELLSGFPSVEIKLGHKRGRTVTRRTKRVDIPERTYAVVTVGEDHQQRAIDQLDGKVVREFRISAKPSSQRLLAEDAREEAREAKKADEAAPEAQPNAEHAEHAEPKKKPTDSQEPQAPEAGPSV